MKTAFSATSEITRPQFMRIIKQDESFSAKDIEMIEKAFAFGIKAHRGQKRLSGSRYFQGHCAHVGLYLHSLGMSQTMIVAGLLHDVLEDTETTIDELEDAFGEEITFLVNSVSRLDSLKYRYYKRHIASLRKFFVAVSQDVRVIIIKLCDRYHNLQTLQYLPPEKQKRIAEESMLIHAQLASRLNMTTLAQAINDLGLEYSQPEDYKKVQKIRKSIISQAEKTIRSAYRKILTVTTEALGYQPLVDRRLKSIYSLYKKLLTKKWQIETIHDIIALRIIVKKQAECYQVLGLIHARWKPMPNRFKDYIALPKPNGYQSLHTTIFIGNGQVIELQIKTEEMHYKAEYGTPAHLNYKKQGSRDPLNFEKDHFHWLDQLRLFTTQKDADIKDYLQELKTDFFKDQIFVITPKGDIVNLIKGATILDFAFAIHTTLGLSAKGGYINGNYKALKTKLQQEDIIEIIVDKRITPQKEWLNWVTTPTAKRILRHYLRKMEPESN